MVFFFANDIIVENTKELTEKNLIEQIRIKYQYTKNQLYF